MHADILVARYNITLKDEDAYAPRVMVWRFDPEASTWLQIAQSNFEKYYNNGTTVVSAAAAKAAAEATAAANGAATRDAGAAMLLAPLAAAALMLLGAA